MTESDRQLLALVSRLLDYPDTQFYGSLPELNAEIATLNDKNSPGADCLKQFHDWLIQAGSRKAQEHYVQVFDHDPAASLYLSWHRYGNDKGQGKAMAALNGLYRAAGFEPVAGTLPDYLPRMLEFLSICDEWAAEVMLDGFGPEMNGILQHLEEEKSAYALPLRTAIDSLRSQWPAYFNKRSKPDRTIRPMASPEPEERLFQIITTREKKV